MKLLTDFDGVLTAQDAEAEAVGARLAEIVAEAELLRRLRAAVRASPERHGWIAGGELACYADEDPYVFHNAVASAVYASGDRSLDRLRALGLATAEHLATRCFEEGTRRYREANASHVLPEAVDAVRRFLAAGHEVVVVSNSSTERVRALLAAADLEPGTRGLRVRGGARKFVLGGEPASVATHGEFGGRRVALRRPHYFEILAEERPDAVIGDVLSLDVALPLALRRAGGPFASMRCHLKRHPHTPDWSLRACVEHGGEPVDSLARLAAKLL